MSAYYNEIEPYAAQWLRNLIAAGHIAPGDVDERSIEDVRPTDLVGYRQCHFFAGIGVWSYALRRAGVPDDAEVWTGSCPCQPFSSAGKGDGFADERHLWPAWHWLISQRHPGRIYGEQVANGDGLAWLDVVCADLEATDYSGWVDDLCSAGFGAPGMRQRLFFVADAESGHGWRELQTGRAWRGWAGLAGGSAAVGMVDAHGGGRAPGQQGGEAHGHGSPAIADGGAGRVVDAKRAGLEGHAGDGNDGDEPRWLPADAARPVAAAGFSRVMVPGRHDRNSVRGYWHSADWVLCRDPRGPRWRPVDAGTFPLAPRTDTRVGRLRAYGNAINAEVATEFIRASLVT